MKTTLASDQVQNLLAKLYKDAEENHQNDR